MAKKPKKGKDQEIINDDDLPMTEEQFLKNRTSGVLTQEEIEKDGGLVPPSIVEDQTDEKSDKDPGKELDKESIKEIPKKTKPDIHFECSYAPMGISNIAFDHVFEGKKYNYKLQLENKIYVLPKNLDETEKKRTRAALKANGFIDVTVIQAGAKFDKKTGKLIYNVMHPEHTSKNRINGSISLVLVGDDNKPMFHKKGPQKGQQVVEQVNIIEGKVTTLDPKIYEALLKAGFYNAGKIEIEEE